MDVLDVGFATVLRPRSVPLEAPASSLTAALTTAPPPTWCLGGAREGQSVTCGSHSRRGPDRTSVQVRCAASLGIWGVDGAVQLAAARHGHIVPI